MEVSWLADTCGSRPHSGQCSYLGEARDIKVGFSLACCTMEEQSCSRGDAAVGAVPDGARAAVVRRVGVAELRTNHKCWYC